MANKTTVQTSFIQENPDVDDRDENIPPGVAAAAETSYLKVQGGNVNGYSSAQSGGDREPLSDTYCFSTPVPASSNGGVKAKPRISGLKSALTPILKYLNIGNKYPSPEPFVSTGRESDFSTGRCVRSSGDKDAPVCWLHDEHLPEITLLDVTCDSTVQMTRNDSALPDSTPATPLKACSMNSTFSTVQHSQLSCSTDFNIAANKPCPLQSKGSGSEVEKGATDQTRPTSRSTTEASLVRNQNISDDKSGRLFDVQDTSCHSYSAQNSALTKMVDIPASLHAPERWLDDRYFPEITLLDVTHDSELSPAAEISSMEFRPDNPLADSVKNGRPASELRGRIVAEPVRLDMKQSKEQSSTLTGNASHTLSSFEDQSDKCVEENMKVSLEATRDVSMGSVLESSSALPETSGQKVVETETSAEDTLDTIPANVTHDLSSSSDKSIQSIESQSSVSDSQCKTSLKNVTTELHIKPVETSNTVEPNSKELPNSHSAALTHRVPPPSPKTAESANGTFTIAEATNFNASTDSNTVAQISCPKNRTLDFTPSNVNSPKAENEGTDQVTADTENTGKTSPIMNQNSSAGKASGLGEMHNATFDRQPLHKSSTHLEEASATSLCLQSNTFDGKPQSIQNGTITLLETSSSNSHCNTLGKPSQSSKLPKENGTTTSTNPNTKLVVNPQSTFEADSAVEVASGADGPDFKNRSHSTPPVSDPISALGHENLDVVNNKANTFNLDDTLDLVVDSWVTSTPMPNCKVSHFEYEEGKIMGAQKKLYTHGPSKPLDQGPSDVSSNIVSDPTTLLMQPAAKSLLLPVKAASQLLKYKPASIPPRRCEPLTSSMPMTRQRAQAEALRNATASNAAQGTTGISGSYNLRNTTTDRVACTGSKLPNSGLLRPQVSGITSGIQRTATGLRPPCARSNAPPTSNTDKLHGPTVTNPVTKASQAKKHPLTRGEALPTAKRKKMDAPLPSSTAEASTSFSNTVNKAKNLKLPTTRALAAKTQRDDAAVPVNTQETSTSCSAAIRAKALKHPTNLLTKPHGNGCAKCVVFQEQLKIKSEEIRRLKSELLKYKQDNKQEGC